jgi:superfamily I DNA and/or RNA helicase
MQHGNVTPLDYLRRSVDAKCPEVAMTRPKRCLIVVGDSETVSKGSKFLKCWMEFLEENADLRYPDLASLDAT